MSILCIQTILDAYWLKKVFSCSGTPPLWHLLATPTVLTLMPWHDDTNHYIFHFLVPTIVLLGPSPLVPCFLQHFRTGGPNIWKSLHLRHRLHQKKNWGWIWEWKHRFWKKVLLHVVFYPWISYFLWFCVFGGCIWDLGIFSGFGRTQKTQLSFLRGEHRRMVRLGGGIKWRGKGINGGRGLPTPKIFEMGCFLSKPKHWIYGNWGFIIHF